MHVVYVEQIQFSLHHNGNQGLIGLPFSTIVRSTYQQILQKFINNL